jgi:hypothetical protein
MVTPASEEQLSGRKAPERYEGRLRRAGFEKRAAALVDATVQGGHVRQDVPACRKS